MAGGRDLGVFGDVGAYLPIEKGARGEVGISVGGWVGLGRDGGEAGRFLRTARLKSHVVK